MKDEKIDCKCERCGRFCKAFQYTKFETKIVEKKIRGNDNPDGSPYFETLTEDIGEKRGLCEECAVEVNKRIYDTQPL